MLILVALLVLANLSAAQMQIMATPGSIMTGDGMARYYAQSMNETIHYILRKSNVTAPTEVDEMIIDVMLRNLKPMTVKRLLQSLDGEMDARDRSNFYNTAIPRITGLYNKMCKLVYGLAEIYGFSGDSVKTYAAMLRPMKLSAIVAAALEGARSDNNTEQYEKISALAKQIENMDVKATTVNPTRTNQTMTNSNMTMPMGSNVTMMPGLSSTMPTAVLNATEIHTLTAELHNSTNSNHTEPNVVTGGNTTLPGIPFFKLLGELSKKVSFSKESQDFQKHSLPLQVI
ncbi:unnamed protein product [Cylicocyclus nassatus]|uniref:Uncharacterized protein n=1 Tax=Cylicocyclus nassatus TaxID=53992 RepID=A0AA36DML9_CYLNA|nr:unnamed protein product [Cylicocyclus nassatus]